jgi:NADH-quinone oxidoreductase subunit F
MTERLKSIAEFKRLREKLKDQSGKKGRRILVCRTTGCAALGAESVLEELKSELKKKGLSKRLPIVETGCQGFCARGPLITVEPDNILYTTVTPEDVKEIVEKTIIRGKVVERLCYKVNGKAVPDPSSIPFFRNQIRQVLTNCGRIDPTKIEEYIGRGGYSALAQVLSNRTPESVIDEVKRSGLRGRGGAGFPTGNKWAFARSAKGEPKYIVCNGDEGDPGAFMDRSVMEGNPHSVIEGMIVGAYAIGASKGFIYVRAEYPLAVKHLGIAIEKARSFGLLGNNILGSNFSFDIEISRGAGAFVCGEETALIASIEGRRGMPRPRPPFPAQSGLWGKPTNINNVETWANVPLIINRGADWFAQFGTETSKGTKIFALAGKVNNTGLVEVPMGATIRNIVFDVGGGILKNRKFKAVQIGGPSGGCLPAQFLDMPLDYESVTKAGAIMGSGGLIVTDESTCMVDIARYFMNFVQSESCGKCTPCRVGTKRMLEILERIVRGEGELSDIDRLVTLGNMVKDSSLCGLGQTAPNSVLSTIRYFRDEYESHIIGKHCAAATCKALVASPCQHTCPAGINVPHYIALVKLGEFSRAADIVRRRNPFASVCGRVCTHPCEILCRRGDMDDSIAIMHLKRAATEFQKEKRDTGSLRTALEKADSKIAIIGAGPAGLACAYFLALMGHSPTVFEKLRVPGGMLMVGIPDYRLPKNILKQEIALIKKAGVRVKTGVTFGKDITIERLRKDGFKAIFISVGAHKGLKLNIPNEETEGVLDGVVFLREVNLGRKKRTGEKVIVVGGGNVAIDSARTALRLGAQSVTIIYRRTIEEMPAEKEEVEEALFEGVQIEFLVAPKAIVKEDGAVKAIECVRMTLGAADESGRRRPVPIPDSQFSISCDTVITAIGQAPQTDFPSDGKLNRDSAGNILVDSATLATSIEGVFAGGDCVTGPATVIEAVAAGQKAAVAIDKYLGGKGELPYNSDPLVEREEKEREVEEKERPRGKVKHLARAKRRCSFRETVLGYSKTEAIKEAERCLRCDLERVKR